MRRRALLAEVRRDRRAVELRGNLDTRLREGRVRRRCTPRSSRPRDSNVSARPRTHGPLDPEWWVPAPGQGALAVEGLAARSDLVELLAPIVRSRRRRPSWRCERAFAARLEGGCSVPLGCRAVVEGDRMTVTGYLGAPDGRALRENASPGRVAEAEELGPRACRSDPRVPAATCLLEEMRDAEAPIVEEP